VLQKIYHLSCIYIFNSKHIFNASYNCLYIKILNVHIKSLIKKRGGNSVNNNNFVLLYVCIAYITKIMLQLIALVQLVYHKVKYGGLRNHKKKYKKYVEFKRETILF
jgi:hypothetical protein